MKISTTVFGDPLIVEHPDKNICISMFNYKLKKEVSRDDRILVRNIKSNGSYIEEFNSWVWRARNYQNFKFLKLSFLLAKDFAFTNNDGSLSVGKYNIYLDNKTGALILKDTIGTPCGKEIE